MKKLVVFLISCSLVFSILPVNAYYNATAEVNQIRDFIAQGLYLEAIKVCAETLSWHDLSADDISLINSLKNDAEWEYNNYVNTLNKNHFSGYYLDEWGMGFNWFSSQIPTFNSDSNYINLTNSFDGYIKVSSFRINRDTLFGKRLYSYQQLSSVNMSLMKELAFEGDSYHTIYEPLSETDIFINGIPARQATSRRSDAINQAHTRYAHSIYKCVSFQYGDWLYLFEALENNYIWSDAFWNAMETYLNSVCFY